MTTKKTKPTPNDLDKMKISASALACALADACVEEEINAGDLPMLAEGLANRLFEFSDAQREEFLATALKDAE
jgi:hypothetical protein